MGSRPISVPFQALLICDTRANFNVHPAENLLHCNFDPAYTLASAQPRRNEIMR